MKFLALPLFLAVAVSMAGAEARVVDEIIAKVNGDIITRSELDRSRKQLEAELRRTGLSGDALEKELAEREKDLLRKRIDELLLVQKANELSINVDPEVSKYMAELQSQSKIAEPEKFQQYVRDQTGQPFEDFRQEMKNQFLTQRVVGQEVGSRIVVPTSDVRKYYEEHKNEFIREDRVFLREILVSTEGKDEQGVAAAEKKARGLAARAKNGERFGELARDNSDGVTAKQFGELGWFKRNELNKQIGDIVFAQERNYVTDPIRVESGFWIGKIEERHRAGQASFEEVENEIRQKLYMPKFEPEIREYLTKLRQQAFLEIKPGFVDTAAAPGKDTKWTDPAQLKPETVTKEEVASQTRRRRLFWLIPIPGTSTAKKSSSSN